MVKKNLILPTTITLTQSQLDGVNKLIDWTYLPIKHPDELIHTLEGYAGTGKTTVLNTFIKNCKFHNSQICVTAPTHKAVRVVSNMTRLSGKTLHSLLGLRPNVNLDTFDINNPAYDTMGNIYIKNYNLVIVDECSQINRDLYTFTIREAKKFNTRILWVGDSAQLPPVNERISQTFLIKNKCTLTEIVRQSKGNPLLELLNVIREDVIRNSSKFIPYLYKHPTVISDKEEGYAFVKRDVFTGGVKKFFSNDKFQTNLSYCRLGSYTNECVKYWNTVIRNVILPDVKDLITLDDLIMSYTTIVDEFNSPIITNSEDYIVSECIPYTNGDNINGWLVRFTNLFDKLIGKYLFIVDSSDENNLSIFTKIHNKLLYDALNAKGGNRSGMFKRYYQFKNRNLLTTKLLRSDGRLLVDKDIDCGYAITVHKLQGTTVDNIFIDLKDIIYNKNGIPYTDVALRNKLLYVALSRAKEKVILTI